MIFSGQTEKQVIETALKSGANKFMSKPAPVEDIKTAVLPYLTNILWALRLKMKNYNIITYLC